MQNRKFSAGCFSRKHPILTYTLFFRRYAINKGLPEFGVMGIANGILTIYTTYV